MTDVNEELMVLSSIYCNEGELRVSGNVSDCRSGEVTISIIIASPTGASPQPSIALTMVIDKTSYPENIPSVSLSTQFVTKKNCDILKNELLRYANTLCGNPMLMDLIIWTQENWQRFTEPAPTSTSESEQHKPYEQLFWSLLQLDHMRSKTKYTKTILKWTKELNLCGHLIFCDKLILILLQGSENSIKEYLHLQRTVSVDVDSKGRSCKERMLTQLTSPQLLTKGMFIFMDFQTLNVESRDDLKKRFDSYGLLSTFKENIQTLSK